MEWDKHHKINRFSCSIDSLPNKEKQAKALSFFLLMLFFCLFLLSLSLFSFFKIKIEQIGIASLISFGALSCTYFYLPLSKNILKKIPTQILDIQFFKDKIKIKNREDVSGKDKIINLNFNYDEITSIYIKQLPYSFLSEKREYRFQIEWKLKRKSHKIFLYLHGIEGLEQFIPTLQDLYQKGIKIQEEGIEGNRMYLLQNVLSNQIDQKYWDLINQIGVSENPEGEKK